MRLRRMLLMGLVCMLAVLGLAVRPVRAVEYRLQVAHLDHHNFFAHLENSSPWWRGEESMGRLEARLDKKAFPPGALIPGREVQLLTDTGYGGKPLLVVTRPSGKEESWTTLVWQGNPGDTVAFVVKTEMLAWQEVRGVATNAEGTLRRLSIGGPALFGRPWQQVPEVAYDYIAHAVDRRTFAPWLERNAKPINGMSIVVGRGRQVSFNPDRVYTVIKQPPEPRTFKLVIGWRDRDSFRNDNGSGGGGATR